MGQETSEKVARLEREIEALKKENERLRRLLEEALRSAKRQAAPFSRRGPKAHPQNLDAKQEASTGGDVVGRFPEVSMRSSTYLCRRSVRIAEGECRKGASYASIRPRFRNHEWSALSFAFMWDAAGVADGGCKAGIPGRPPMPSAVLLRNWAPERWPWPRNSNKGLGLPYGKTAAVLEEAFGLRVSRGGLCQALQRVANKAEPTYQALVEQVRASPSVTPDETGWRVGGQLWWMWVFSTAQVSVYAIQPGRGFEQAAMVLGADFAGFLVRDGWSAYRQFLQALHQTCLAHLLRRCREMILVAGQGETVFPRTVQAILQAALQLRDRREEGQISERGLAVARGRLEARLDRSLQRSYRSPRNRRLANHLVRERDALFTFLNCPGLEATNWRAEQAIRPMVVTRKVWGGNRTTQGARTQGILVSILQTCRQQLRCASSILQTLICSSQPKVLDLTAPTR